MYSNKTMSDNRFIWIYDNGRCYCPCGKMSGHKQFECGQMCIMSYYQYMQERVRRNQDLRNKIPIGGLDEWVENDLIDNYIVWEDVSYGDEYPSMTFIRPKSVSNLSASKHNSSTIKPPRPKPLERPITRIKNSRDRLR
jgi:hypothetical protein